MGRPGLEAARLTLLQLDVAASFDLCDPAVVDGPGGFWNRPSSGSAPRSLCGSGKPTCPHHGPPPLCRQKPFSKCDSDPMTPERLSGAHRGWVTCSRGHGPGTECWAIKAGEPEGT